MCCGAENLEKTTTAAESRKFRKEFLKEAIKDAHFSTIYIGKKAKP